MKLQKTHTQTEKFSQIILFRISHFLLKLSETIWKLKNIKMHLNKKQN